MKRVIFAFVAATVMCAPFAIRAQDSKTGESSPAKIMEMQAGVWDAEITMTVPDAEGKITKTTSKGEETNRLLGGKWLISDFKGEFFGQSFEGHGTNGFDEKKKKYVGTWVDSMSNHIDLLEGSYDEKTKTLTLNADSENPADGKPMKMRLETHFNDDGSRVFSEFVKVDGQSDFAKFMEVKYTKRKS
jgi:Protein of unknown function (DUF1579)